MKDLDHKISRAIVDYAFKNKLKIVVEDLKGVRTTAKKGNGFKGKIDP
jgi:IS605 OrfB family transposase